MMKGNLIVVSAPSGAGKSTLVNAILAGDPHLRLSVSHTTRAPRPGETNGREYHFVDVPTFESMKAGGVFLEHALVHGNYYGTSRHWLEQARALNQDIILELDWQGARQVRAMFADAVTVFVLPPSSEELERRLRARGKDSEHTIRERLANAAEEIGHWVEFDYVIINNEFADAREDLAAIVRAVRLRCASQAARRPEIFGNLASPRSTSLPASG